MVRALNAAVAAWLILAAVSASAQEPTPLEMEATSLFETCAAAVEGPINEQSVQACVSAEDAALRLTAEIPNTNFADKNAAWLLIATAQLSLGRAYMGVDGNLSVRACEAMDRSWYTVGLLHVDYLGSEIMDSVENGASDVISNCRRNFSMPVWGRALPSDEAQNLPPLVDGAFAQLDLCDAVDHQTNPQQGIEACEAAETMIGTLQVHHEDASVAQESTGWFVSAGVQMLLAGSYFFADGNEVLTERACHAYERAWRSLGNLRADDFGQNELDMVASQALTVVEVCRQEFSTPRWARPLP